MCICCTKLRIQQEKGKGWESSHDTEVLAQERDQKSGRMMLKRDSEMTATQEARKATIPCEIGRQKDLGGISPRKVMYLNIEKDSCFLEWGDQLMIKKK